MLAGSGTAAVEVMIGSFVPRQGHALVVTNSVYGERMAAMLAAQGAAPLLDIAAPSSSALTAYRAPGEMDYASLHAALKTAGFVIYAGQGRFQNEIFRIAVMGELSTMYPLARGTAPLFIVGWSLHAAFPQSYLEKFYEYETPHRGRQPADASDDSRHRR